MVAADPTAAAGTSELSADTADRHPGTASAGAMGQNSFRTESKTVLSWLYAPTTLAASNG